MRPHRQLAYSTCSSALLQTAAQLEWRGKSNYSAQLWWEKQSKDERKLDKQGKVEAGRWSTSLFPSALRSRADVLFPFVDCGALPRQQLLLLYPLLWSNPSLSCAVLPLRSLSQPLRRWGSQRGGSATSLITDLFSRNGVAGLIYFKKQGRSSFYLSVFIGSSDTFYTSYRFSRNKYISYILSAISEVRNE